MVHPTVRRAGAAAAIVGSLLGLVFNVLHPRGSSFETNEHLGMVAGSRIWIFDHYMLFWAIAISLIGLIVIGRSFEDEPAASWGRIAAGWAMIGGAVALVLLMVDGIATPAAAGRWAAGQSPETLAAGAAVAHVELSLFTGLMLTFFGVTPIVYGIAVLGSDEHPKWLGYLAIASGLLGLLAGSIQFFNGPTPLTASVIFPIGSVAFTLWGVVMGARLWKRSSEAPSPTARAAAA